MRIYMRTGRYICATLALALVTAVLAPANARAGVAYVAQCVDNAGNGARSELASADASSTNFDVITCAPNRSGALLSRGVTGSNNAAAEVRSIYFNAPGQTHFVGGLVHRRMTGYRYSAGDTPSWAFGYRLSDDSKQILEHCGAASYTPDRGTCSDGPNSNGFSSTIFTMPSRATRYYTISVGCWIAGKCAHYMNAPGISEVSGEFAVLDEGYPTINSVTGAAVSEGIVTRGADDVSINASDVGGLGVYRASFRLDGQVVGTELWDNNGGACHDFDSSSRRLFRAGQPCLPTPPTRTFGLPATVDGAHRIQVEVEDASGNVSRALDRYVTIDRLPPVLSQEPAVRGVARVGQTLTCAVDGVDGQSPTTSYQWVRTLPDGSDARDIAGATSASYQAVAADTGGKLLCRVAVTDRGGTSSRTSNATAGPFADGATVAAASGPTSPTPTPTPTPTSDTPGPSGTAGADGNNGSNGAPGTSTSGAVTAGGPAATAPGPAGPGSTQGPVAPAPGCPIGTLVTLEGSTRLVTKRARSAAAIAGVVRSGSGAPAAGVAIDLVQRVRRSGDAAARTVATGTSDANGRFSLTAPVGPSRDLQVVTRTCGASGPVVGQTVRGSVQLKAVTSHVLNGQLARFRGRALGGYYGKGLGLELQVLVGRQWRDVRSVKTDRAGRYATSYRFKRTFVRFTYRFRVVSRAGAGWPYTATKSSIAKVRVN